MYKPILINYNELDPYISNYNLYNHYKIYLENLNKLNSLLLSINYKKNWSLEYLIKNIDTFNLNIRANLLYYASSVLNHETYFKYLSNKKNNYPKGKLLNDINKNFDSYDNFKKEFIKTALNLKGSGYTYLVKDNDKLKIINTSNEDNPLYYGYIPVFNIDMWEHAYYLDYKDKLEYINEFFNIIDYEKISLDYT